MLELSAYQVETRRTSRNEDIFDKAITEYSQGLVGESGEVLEIVSFTKIFLEEEKKKDLVLELGDITWYVARTLDIFGIPFEEISKSNMENILVSERKLVLSGENLIVYTILLSIETSKYVDYVKKYLHQGHKINAYVVANYMSNILWYINLIGSDIGYTLEEIAADNLKKLRKRYPEGFEVQKSILRNAN